MTTEPTPFADQVEKELKAVQEFWDRLRANPEFRRAALAISRGVKRPPQI